MSRSLKVPGSPSSLLQTMYLSPGNARGMKLHLSPVGKPAPPPPAQRAGLEFGDDVVTLHLLGDDAAQCLVAAVRDIGRERCRVVDRLRPAADLRCRLQQTHFSLSSNSSTCSGVR